MIDNLNLKILRIRFFTEQHIRMKYWIGAVLRNRFLYVAESVYVNETMSLRRIIETLPLSEEHFMFRQLQEGFPKGFLFDCSDLPYDGSGFVLRPNTIYCFSLILIGKLITYQASFLEAISRMINDGFGHPMVSLELVDVTEGDLCVLPDLILKENRFETLELVFKTPVSLMHLPKGKGSGFQNKLNNFPSFYQFMRSLMYRVVTLEILYSDGISFENRKEMDEWIEEYIAPSMKAVLLQANLCYEKRYSTPKVGETSVYSMAGYTGRLIFGKVHSDYLPLLSALSPLGVGSDVNYGLGTFRVSYRSGY